VAPPSGSAHASVFRVPADTIVSNSCGARRRSEVVKLAGVGGQRRGREAAVNEVTFPGAGGAGIQPPELPADEK
jgi:hypothetical protein